MASAAHGTGTTTATTSARRTAGVTLEQPSPGRTILTRASGREHLAGADSAARWATIGGSAPAGSGLRHVAVTEALHREADAIGRDPKAVVKPHYACYDFSVGRPAKVLDDLITKRICDATAAGLSRTAVAAKAGISRSLFLEWLAKGRAGEAPYVDLLDAVKVAEAKAEEVMVQAIRTAGLEPSKWQAAAWWLERSRPADWAKREPTHEQEHERAETGEHDLDVAKSVVAALESRKAS